MKSNNIVNSFLNVWKYNTRNSTKIKDKNKDTDSTPQLLLSYGLPADPRPPAQCVTHLHPNDGANFGH